MDRRQKKTRSAIFLAFCKLLAKKRYDKITVQEIIDEADVGRTTFYAHFETKDLLLDAMCDELFCHVFNPEPCEWEGRDDILENRLAHILWHFKENNNTLSALILSDSSDLFLRYFKTHLSSLFESFLTTSNRQNENPFLLLGLVGSFWEILKWWLNSGMKQTPEAVAKNFLKLYNIE